MTEREEVANKLQRLIAAYKAFKRVRNDYPAVGREGVTAAIIAEIDRNLARSARKSDMPANGCRTSLPR